MGKYPNANVHPDAKIGENVTVEPFATICKDVVIGNNTWIGPNAVLMDGSRVGKSCKIYPGAVIAGHPQDLKYKGEETIAEIGDNTIIREFVTVNKGTAASGKNITKVGSNCLIMSYVHVAHDCVVGDNVILAGFVGLAGEVEVGDWAIVGGGTVVHQFSRIGMHAMISGGSRMGKDVPPYVLAGHIPLAYGGTNTIGLRRRGFTNEQINQIHDYYRIIYQSNLNVSQALEEMEKQPATAERDIIINFIGSSKRGIIKTGDENAEFEL
ncbi:MAG: acyl-ACP--UDP-N-acetylglucosamine O-acyltransferase [Prevotellaceae bacterium]|jgi:UDP-N-acetylglucosamine acyltransferase|nr:acyl-ACP--UDP-N-acetylglucosamine O-acyltransferase [Prevotellaceae bacterium]